MVGCRGGLPEKMHLGHSLLYLSFCRDFDRTRFDAIRGGTVCHLPLGTSSKSSKCKKTDLLSQIERWPPEKLSHRPTPANWCLLEMLDHIVETEVAILSAARRGLANPHRIGIADKLRATFLQKIFASDVG